MHQSVEYQGSYQPFKTMESTDEGQIMSASDA